VNIWIIFAIGIALGLVIGNKTLRTKTVEFLRSLGQKKEPEKKTIENKCPGCRYYEACKNAKSNPNCPYFSSFPNK